MVQFNVSNIVKCFKTINMWVDYQYKYITTWKKSLHPFFNKYNARKYLLSSGSKIFVWFVGIN